MEALNASEHPTAPEPLTAAHELDAFDCGIDALNEWLQRRALQNQADGASRTFVICAQRRVVGYYAMAATSIAHAFAAGKIRRNMPDPVPAVLIARLAVDRNWQRGKIGLGLLLDAALRATATAESIGIRAILVDAKNEQAKAFYQRFGFRESPIQPMMLMMSIDEIRRRLERNGAR